MIRYRVLFYSLCVSAVTIAAYHFGFSFDWRTNDATQTVKAYLQKTYARDFKNAYQYLSIADRQSRGEASYVESQGAYSGFALEAVTKLASFMQVWPIEQSRDDERRRIKVGYRVPAPADLAGLLLNWDEAQLNALPRDRQQQILAEIDARRKDSKLLMIEGQESLELRKDGKAWKIFLDWASGTTVKLKTQLPKSGELEVRFAQTEVIAKNDELFLVNLVIKNRGSRTVTFTVGHLIDPDAIANDLELVECGLLTPVTLQAGSTQEFSMAYLLGSAARHNYREFSLTYEFKLK